MARPLMQSQQGDKRITLFKSPWLCKYDRTQLMQFAASSLESITDRHFHVYEWCAVLQNDLLSGDFESFSQCLNACRILPCSQRAS